MCGKSPMGGNFVLEGLFQQDSSYSRDITARFNEDKRQAEEKLLANFQELCKQGIIFTLPIGFVPPKVNLADFFVE